jgi:hypothetical protein
MITPPAADQRFSENSEQSYCGLGRAFLYAVNAQSIANAILFSLPFGFACCSINQAARIISLCALLEIQ